MTSTNFNIGLSEGNKNSSRVLRPPGGGHSDIFGAQETAQTPSKRRNYPTSTIGSCFSMQDDRNTTKKEDIQNENAVLNGENGCDKTNQHVENGVDKNTKDSKENNNSETDSATIPASRRGRVPPGGYSTPLW